MSYYNYQNTGHPTGQPAAQAAGLQFIPTQFGAPSYGDSSSNNTTNPGISGSMAGTPSGNQYFYGADMQKERLSTGILAAFGTSGYPGEPPLLEELGVNFAHIKSKTMAVLNPFGIIDQNIMDDSDLAGPLVFVLLFGTFLLLSGKVHFGYIYGVGLIGTLAQYAVLNLMALKSIDFTRTASVLGYCLLPLVATSALSVVVSLNNAFGYILSCFTVAWCTYSSSGIFVSYLRLSETRALVAYPLALFYGVFSVMTLFAENVTAKTKTGL